MRLTVAAAAVAAVALGLALAPDAAAKRRVVASHCSTTGDLCYGIARKGRGVYLRIDTFARYFARYRLCVRGPEGSTDCRTFTIRRRGRIYGSTVTWNAWFPRYGPGPYRVTWRLGTRKLGPALAFRVGRR